MCVRACLGEGGMKRGMIHEDWLTPLSLHDLEHVTVSFLCESEILILSS